LINGDRSARRKRQSQIRQEIKEYIKEYRMKYGKIHQNEIKPYLDKYCKDKGIKSESIASIGRIIKELKEKGELDNGQRLRLNARGGNLREVKNNKRAKERRKGYIPKRPGDLVQVDSVHLMIEGKRAKLKR
jgi:hypothetical protein